jgi:hypothetical protein
MRPLFQRGASSKGELPATRRTLLVSAQSASGLRPRIGAPMGVRTGAVDAGCATVAVTITATLTKNAAPNRIRPRATVFCAKNGSPLRLGVTHR